MFPYNYYVIITNSALTDNLFVQLQYFNIRVPNLKYTWPSCIDSVSYLHTNV